MRQIRQRCPSSVNRDQPGRSRAGSLAEPDLQATQTGRHMGSPPLKRAVRTLGNRVGDQRSKVVKALAALRSS